MRCLTGSALKREPDAFYKLPALSFILNYFYFKLY